MQCFVCGKPVLPERGYFKTQLFDGKKICHISCRPHFFYEKPEDKQEKLFEPEDWREQK